MSDVKPYVPNVVPKTTGAPRVDTAKPWLSLKPGETTKEWSARVKHSCYRCGHYEDDLDALDAHEQTHG